MSSEILLMQQLQQLQQLLSVWDFCSPKRGETTANSSAYDKKHNLKSQHGSVHKETFAAAKLGLLAYDVT